MTKRLRFDTLLAAGCLAGLLGVAAASAQATPPNDPKQPIFTSDAGTPPPRLSAPTISLDQALSLALTWDPNIHLANAAHLSEQGAYSVQLGTFDHTVTAQLEGRYDRAELLPGPFRQQAGQRLLFRTLATKFQEVADRLRDNVAGHPGGRTYIPCEDNASGALFTEGTEVAIIDPETGATTATITCTPASEIAQQEAQDLFIQGIINSTTGAGHDALVAAQQQNLDVANQAILAIADILDAQAVKMRERDRKIGQTPTLQEGHQFSLTLGYQMPFRTGTVVTPLFTVQRTETHNVGKGTTKPNFLGRSTRDTYRAGLALDVQTPLLRGFGYAAVTGPERAARLGVIASNAEVHQQESVTALRTALAYWNLIAAQQRAALFEESLNRQLQLSSLARSLAAADEIARVELLNVDSRVADARGFLASARSALATARIELAKQLGVQVLTVDDAPLASDGFPDVADYNDLKDIAPDAMQKMAVDGRFDVLAASRRLDASRVLIDTARSNLRQRLDLGLTVGYLGFEENQNVGKGFRGALLGNWVGPSVLLSLHYELPFGNNFALGQLQQAYALANSGDVRLTNLRRTIDSRIVEALSNLKNAAAEVDRGEAAVRLYRQTIDNEYTKYKAGESTLIDYILTEENLTGALSTLISARQAYAEALARLRYETGTLVTYGPSGATASAASLRRFPF